MNSKKINIEQIPDEQQDLMFEMLENKYLYNLFLMI